MNGVLLQGFHWYMENQFPGSEGRKLWSFLRDEAGHYRAIGIDAIWIPPAYRGANALGVGYDVYDHYNTGEFGLNGQKETRYGSKEQLHKAVEALHGNGTEKYISVYGDIVLNHKTGGQPNIDFWEAIRVENNDRTVERWGEGVERGKIELKAYTRFDYPERASRYSSFKWDARHFDSVDSVVEIRQNGHTFHDSGKYIYRFLANEEGYLPHYKNFDKWVDLEKGNFDFLISCDFDYGRTDVREEMKAWGSWYVHEFQLDGVRLDAVKHISAHYIQEWLGHVRHQAGKELFAVAEYISGSMDILHMYLQMITSYWDYPQRVSLFDFPLFFKFNEAGKRGEHYNLQDLFNGTIQAEQPSLAVTFVENHDYEYGRGWQCHIEAWFKPIAYAFILLREPGYPCIFFPDYYGSFDSGDHKAYLPGRPYLDLLLKLRKEFAYGQELHYVNNNVAGWTRLGFTPEARGAMAVVINTAYDRVQSIRMNTARNNRVFYHFATIRWTEAGYIVAEGGYERYGDKKCRLNTDFEGWASFPSDGGSVAIWIEEGV